jgi:hypothetical protein
VTLTSGFPLFPSPSSYLVKPAFYGGPLDGSQEMAVTKDELLGRIRKKSGSYELVGFMSSALDDDPLKEYSMDIAVYEWH